MTALQRLAALLVALVVAFAPVAAPAQDLSGDWVFNVEGRNIMVLRLAADEAGGLEGTLARPERFSMTLSGGALGVVGATPEVVERRVETVAMASEGVHIAVFDPAAPEADSRREYRLQAVGEDRAELRVPGAEDAPVIPLMRPRPALEVAPDLDPSRTYIDRQATPSDPELAEMFDADQAARRGGRTDWSVVEVEDRARRDRVRELMAEGRVNSADDYWRAAFIFQHGDTPEDYLLAHSLAVASTGMGKGEATWIAAATLDRYLHTIGRPQVYGTQYQMSPGQPVSQGDYNRELIPDSVRVASGVPTLDQQAEHGRQFEQPAE